MYDRKPQNSIKQLSFNLKKSSNLTEARTKTTLQKVNQDEKAESYVPDEGTR